MPNVKTREQLNQEYEEAARKYMASLPLEHFMESTPQATQRKITVASLELVTAQRPEVQVFSELLVQYTLGRSTEKRKVVPDNMVVVHDEPIEAVTSFSVPLQPVGPFWVLEYVSKGNMRKDYEDNMRRYERELRVPYYLLFYPDTEDLSLYRRGARKYASVKPNEHDRYAIAELQIEVALLGGWVRYWFRGELLPLPADLFREVNRLREQVEGQQQRLRRQDDLLAAQAEEIARLRARLGLPGQGTP